MPAERMNMKKIREILRLKYESNLSERAIAQSCRTSKTSVGRCLDKARVKGLFWPLPVDLDDETLEQLLYPTNEVKAKKALFDWPYIHQELKKKGVTLELLWLEYKQREPNILSYSRFCYWYREFKKQLSPVMRQSHKAGEKLFVDYAGLSLAWSDTTTGEIHQAQIFVAVMGASNYTYVEATRTQSLPDWIASHVSTFEFLGGLPEIVVPDNLKSGVSCPHLYDPQINLTYQDMANHYGIAVVPTRVGSPKDKAKVEVGVQGIERWILAPLRHRTFLSLSEINAAIKPLLNAYNQRAFQKLPGTRLSAFQSIDQPALKSLPAHVYQYATWKKARAGADYHVAYHYHYYSVPHQYIRHELDLKITRDLIQCFYKNKLIAVHPHAKQKGYSTLKEHMPKSHQAYAEWTPERILRWAKQIGGQTEAFINALIQSRVIPQQAFRACLGVLRLSRSYGNDRLEKAAHRALSIGALSYQSIASILKKGLDQQPVPESQRVNPAHEITHENLRGKDYYYH